MSKKYWIDRLIIKNAGVHLSVFVTIFSIPLLGWGIFLEPMYYITFGSISIIEALNPTE